MKKSSWIFVFIFIGVIAGVLLYLQKKGKLTLAGGVIEPEGKGFITPYPYLPGIEPIPLGLKPKNKKEILNFIMLETTEGKGFAAPPTEELLKMMGIVTIAPRDIRILK